VATHGAPAVGPASGRVAEIVTDVCEWHGDSGQGQTMRKTSQEDTPPGRNAAGYRGEAEPGWPWALLWPAGLFTIITFFVGADIAADLSDGVSPAHLVLEAIALVLCLAGTAGTGLQLRVALRRARQLQRDLEGTRADLVRWRDEATELLSGLRGVIDIQFERWGLTSAQSEVALLVLKGLSYKEIADVRQTSERTVRNQALALYRKAGVANRAEMAAFFLEDLLVPRERGQRTDSRAVHGVVSADADAAVP
jgi:DNA-binding CsgD family transcriptional regulator